MCRANGCHFVRFSFSMAKPCLHIIIDDRARETIAFEPSQHILACNLGHQTARPLAEMLPLPRHWAQRAPDQKPTTQCTRTKSEPIPNPSSTIKNGRYQKRSPQNRANRRATKNDQKQSKTCFSLPRPNRSAIASHQTAPPRPTTRNDCTSIFLSVAASSMAGMTAH